MGLHVTSGIGFAPIDQKLRELRKAESFLSIINDLGIDYYFHGKNLYLELDQYQKTCENWMDEPYGLGELVAMHLNELDDPTHYSKGQAFCELFALDKKQSKAVLDACATEEQWQEYVSFCRRNYNL